MPIPELVIIAEVEGLTLNFGLIFNTIYLFSHEFHALREGCFFRDANS